MVGVVRRTRSTPPVMDVIDVDSDTYDLDLDVSAKMPPAKKRALSTPAPFEDWEVLSDDIVRHLFGLLELDAINLKQACSRFSSVNLSDGMALALKALQCEPNKPDLALHHVRTPTAAVVGKWDSSRFFSGLTYRMEWASLTRLIDAAPIDTVIDAFLLIPKHEHNNEQCDELLALEQFLHESVAKHHRGSSASPVTNQRTKRMAEWIPSEEHYLALWYELSPEEKRHYMPTKSQHKRGGSKHTRTVRVVLHKCIEARLWDVIGGHDVIKSDPVTEMRVPMSNEKVLRTVQRMFDKSVNVHNGPTSFFYTPYGWLGFTPFLLAAERQNLPLVKYLHETFPESITIGSRSQAGNNAYALSEGYLRQYMRRTPCEMRRSAMLAYLCKCVGCQDRKRDEYEMWEC